VQDLILKLLYTLQPSEEVINGTEVFYHQQQNRVETAIQNQIEQKLAAA
jgi:hypothetical protein